MPIKVLSLDVSLSSTGAEVVGIVAGVEALDVCADTAGEGPDEEDVILAAIVVCGQRTLSDACDSTGMYSLARTVLSVDQNKLARVVQLVSR